MAARIDLLLDSTGDLPIGTRGLMPVGASDLQHQKDMFSSFAGEWKQFIFNGIGVSRYLKSSGNTLMVLKKEARQQLQNDGYSVGNMKIKVNGDGKFIIKTNASR